MRSRNFFALRHSRVDNFLLSTLYTKRKYERTWHKRTTYHDISLQVLDEKQTSRRTHWRTAAHGDKLATGLRYRAPRQVTAASYTTLSLARAASPHHPRKRARKRTGVNERKKDGADVVPDTVGTNTVRRDCVTFRQHNLEAKTSQVEQQRTAMVTVETLQSR